MELQHVNVKIFVDGDLGAGAVRFIDVFHQWVRDQVLDELLIDVVDYRHVPAGPGVLLVGQEADYSMDNTGDRWGLRYNRKAPLAGDNGSRLRHAFGSALHACRLLEEQLAGDDPLKFSRREFELFINDRALASNTSETFATCRPELEAFLENAFGHSEFSLRHDDDPRSRFRVTIKLANPFDLSAVLEMLRSHAGA